MCTRANSSRSFLVPRGPEVNHVAVKANARGGGFMRTRREIDKDSVRLLPAHSHHGGAEMREPLEQAATASQEALPAASQSISTEVIGPHESNAELRNRSLRTGSSRVTSVARRRKQHGAVLLPEWVNEKLPALDQILSAHDVARLTRRSRWVVYALTLLGRFPRRQRFRNRAIGWTRHDVVTWLAERAPREREFRRRLHRRRTRSPSLLQLALPMHLARTRRARGPCGRGRKGGRL
jgi:predicted DNA-binding transcriptional regulator AlpA